MANDHLPALPRKRLGKTGLEVTTVGIGTGWIGQHAGRLDEDLAVQTIWAALEAGVNLIDTAPLYQQTASERLIGRALAERPDLAKGVIVETKVGHVPDDFDYTYDASMRCIEGSLARLGVAHLPIVYIHDAPSILLERVMAPNGALGALRKLQQQGVVGHIGIAVNDPDQNAPYIETGEFEVAVVPEAYSLLNQVALERIFPAAERFGTGIVIAVPLEKGLLATGARKGLSYPGRSFSPECLAHVRAIEDLCATFHITLLAAALQFCIRHLLVATTIPGARVPDEARLNALAGREVIPDAFWQELHPLVRTWSRASTGSEWVSTVSGA